MKKVSEKVVLLQNILKEENRKKIWD